MVWDRETIWTFSFVYTEHKLISFLLQTTSNSFRSANSEAFIVDTNKRWERLISWGLSLYKDMFTSLVLSSTFNSETKVFSKESKSIRLSAISNFILLLVVLPSRRQYQTTIVVAITCISIKFSLWKGHGNTVISAGYADTVAAHYLGATTYQFLPVPKLWVIREFIANKYQTQELKF